MLMHRWMVMLKKYRGKESKEPEHHAINFPSETQQEAITSTYNPHCLVRNGPLASS